MSLRNILPRLKRKLNKQFCLKTCRVKFTEPFVFRVFLADQIILADLISILGAGRG